MQYEILKLRNIIDESILQLEYLKSLIDKFSSNYNKPCLFLDIDGKTYRMADVSYPDALKMMRAFVKKRRVPDCSLCVEVAYLDIDQMRSTFTELATLLLGDAKQAKSFMTKAKLRSMEELEDSWWNLYEKLVSKGYAVELSCKCELEDFIYYVQKLIRNNQIPNLLMFCFPKYRQAYGDYSQLGSFYPSVIRLWHCLHFLKGVNKLHDV